MVTKLEQQGKQIFQWGEKFVDIVTLEKAVYEAVLSLGRNIMRQCIEEADRARAQQRDRGQYRDKGCRAALTNSTHFTGTKLFAPI